VDSDQHGNSESHAGIGVTAAWPCQQSGHADWTANLKLPTQRCGAVGIPRPSAVGGGQDSLDAAPLFNGAMPSSMSTSPWTGDSGVVFLGDLILSAIISEKYSDPDVPNFFRGL
jgi:hypothetical protein